MDSKPTTILTPRLKLRLESIERARERLDQMPPEMLAEVSPDWLARIRAATEPDPWVHGFAIRTRSDDELVGSIGFKVPPDDGGMVEVAYAVEPDYQGKGYATEAVGALVPFAFEDERVRTVRAHTLPEKNASTRVLTKCGFEFLGEVVDPEDGPVWRWERKG